MQPVSTKSIRSQKSGKIMAEQQADEKMTKQVFTCVMAKG